MKQKGSNAMVDYPFFMSEWLVVAVVSASIEHDHCIFDIRSSGIVAPKKYMVKILKKKQLPTRLVVCRIPIFGLWYIRSIVLRIFLYYVDFFDRRKIDSL